MAHPTRPTPISRPVAALAAVAGLLVGVVTPLAAQTVDSVPTDPTVPTVTTDTTAPTGSTLPPGPTVPPDPLPGPAPDLDVAPPPPVVPDGGIRDLVVDPNGPPPVLRDPTPRIRVLLARLDVLDRQAKVKEANDVLFGVLADAVAAGDLVTAGEAEVGEAEQALAAARGLMSAAAVNSFMYATGGATATSTGFGEFDQRRGEELSESVLDHRQRLIDEAEVQLDQARSQLVAVRRVQRAADERVAAFQVLVGAVDDQLRTAQRGQAEATAGSAPRNFDRAAPGGWQLEIMGPSAFTADELVAWYAEKGQGGQTSEPVLDVVRYYVEEGQLEGVRGDVALAQAVLETGWFRNDDTRRFNNYAGIGHCDSCPTGFGFPSARIGVRAQLQHLKTYVMADPGFANPLVDRRLYGPAACCQTWNELTGVWATSPIYGPTLLAIYEQMLDWLVARRTMMGG